MNSWVIYQQAGILGRECWLCIVRVEWCVPLAKTWLEEMQELALKEGGAFPWKLFSALKVACVIGIRTIMGAESESPQLCGHGFSLCYAPPV